MTTVSSTSSASAGRSAALAGIGFMLVATFLFALNSAAGKWLVAKYPVGEFMLIRSSFTLLFLAPFIWHAGRAAFANAPRPGVQVLRVVLASLEVAMFFWAVSYLPLADTTTFYLAGPIYVTALSVLLLREQRRMAALDRGADRLYRRRHRAAAIVVQLHTACADRARGKHNLRAGDDHDAHAAPDQRRHADDDLLRRRCSRSASPPCRSAGSRRMPTICCFLPG